jgi:hypothetical protein
MVRVRNTKIMQRCGRDVEQPGRQKQSRVRVGGSRFTYRWVSMKLRTRLGAARGVYDPYSQNWHQWHYGQQLIEGARMDLGMDTYVNEHSWISTRSAASGIRDRDGLRTR